MHLLASQRGQKVLETLELNLQKYANHHVHVGNRTQVL